LWDTAGQERFRAVARPFYRNALGGLLVFDITNAASFKSAEKWLNELKQFGDKNIAILLVGNKSDLKDKREVATEDAKNFAQKNALYYMETSALDGANVKEAFQQIVTTIHETNGSKTLSDDNKDTRQIKEGSTIKLEEEKKDDQDNIPKPPKKGCC